MAIYQNIRRACSARISLAMLVRDSPASSANGANIRHARASRFPRATKRGAVSALSAASSKGLRLIRRMFLERPSKVADPLEFLRPAA